MREVPKPLVLKSKAVNDVHAIIDHYLEESQSAAAGFVDALEAAYKHIERAPGTGSPRWGHALDLPGLRSWPCTRYPYLVFYMEHPNRVDIWRVLHGRRDIPAWLHDDDDLRP